MRMADRRRHTGTVAVLAVAALVCVACTRSTPTKPQATSATRAGGTIVVLADGEPSGFNIRSVKSATIAGNMVMSMVWPSVWRTLPDSSFALNTDLMASADVISTEPQTVVYKINPRAAWADGVPIDVDDFIYNWQMSRPGAVDVDGSPIQSGASQGSLDPIASVTGSDGGKTVTVVFKANYRPWRALFSTLMPAHIARSVGWNTGFDRFDPNVVISGGPFRIASYNPGSDLTLVPNEHITGPTGPGSTGSFCATAASPPLPPP